ncbi:MAG: flagellin FliC, partial [Thiotrichales bacterium]|nr:flagellin FliC [Thiotrichales bacterium]
SANLARTQILQQAGMSMLSQANQSQQNVLSLLK